MPYLHGNRGEASCHPLRPPLLLGLHLSLAPFQSVISNLPHLQKWTLNLHAEADFDAEGANGKGRKWDTTSTPSPAEIEVGEG